MLFLGKNCAVLGIVWLLFWVHLVGIKGTTWWLFLEVNGGCWWRGKMAMSAEVVLGLFWSGFEIQRLMYGRWNMMDFLLFKK